ncbi:hypothetical protein ACFY94_25910 [Streptomyces griseorubiginosus]|uniref:hypothetical protein n=1 Tax=Streptomyces griseorubiginosus TaxID=67304 RepID=UPI0036F14D37
MEQDLARRFPPSDGPDPVLDANPAPAGVEGGRLVEAVLASMVAVAGTLIGSLSTYLFQRRIAERADAASRQERLRQERLAVYSGYAGAVSELKRGLITVWFRRRASPRDEDAYLAARVESDRLGATADTADFRLQLVADDPVLRRLMDAIRAKLGAIDAAEDRQQLIVIESEFEQAVRAFLDAAARLIG